MAKAARKKPDEKIAPKIVKRTSDLISGVLILVGKPFYFLLSHLIIGLLFVFYVIGKLTRILLTFFFNLLRTLILSLFKTGKRRLSLKKTGVRPIFKLIFLKTTLSFLKISRYLSKIRLPRLEPSQRPKIAFFSVLIIFFSSLFLFWFHILRDIPSPYKLTSRELDVSTKIYDRNGTLLYQIYKDHNRTPISLDKVPLHVRLATLAAEDAEFYSHPGFSIRGIIRAVKQNIRKGELLTGGSTITQQLVKNALLSSEKTIVRKIREIILSVQVELAYSKDEILEMYLNEVSYGGTAYGIQEASRHYFGKDADKITLAEAALLAGLPKSPTRFSPFGANPDLSIARQKEVLNLMVANRFVAPEQRDIALEETLHFAPNITDIKAPHFVMFVRQQLEEKYGREMVERGGLEVVTTLDYEIQQIAEEAVRAEVDRLGQLRVGNGAALVLDPGTGEILAMVGSKNYFDTDADGNVNVTTRLRQPGSAIKVINYAYALSTNYTLATILADTPVTFSVPGGTPYSPRNYDSGFRGNLSLRSALAESRNVPAVKVLATYGVDKMVETGMKMGITTWDNPERFDLSLTLGGGGVKLIDLATVYATIANYGARVDPTSTLKVTTYAGKVLEENSCVFKTGSEETLLSFLNFDPKPVFAAEAARHTCGGEQVLDPRVAFLLVDILNDNSARAPAFGSFSQLVIPNHPEVAVKTGTSNNLRDNWTFGFNQNYLVAVWVGNNDNSPMSRVASGVTGATPIWNKIISSLLAQEENHNWEVPSGLVQVPICSLTGTLPCEGCPTKMEWFLEENVPQTLCSPEQIRKIIGEDEASPEGDREGQIFEPGAATEEPGGPRRPFIRLGP